MRAKATFEVEIFPGDPRDGEGRVRAKVQIDSRCFGETAAWLEKQLESKEFCQAVYRGLMDEMVFTVAHIGSQNQLTGTATFVWY